MEPYTGATVYYDHQADDQLRGWMPASPWSVMTPVLRTQTASPTETCNYQSGQGGVELEPHLAGPEQAVVHPEQRALPHLHQSVQYKGERAASPTTRRISLRCTACCRNVLSVRSGSPLSRRAPVSGSTRVATQLGRMK